MEETKIRNNATLSDAACYLRLMDFNKPFEEMENDDLDGLYAVAFKRCAYHLTRQGYIDALNIYRNASTKRANKVG